MDSLWGEIPKEGNITPPVAILREQGALLGEATNKILVGKTGVTKDAGKIIINFYINAPALDNYSMNVLRVTHDVMLYPVTVSDFVAGSGVVKCPDEDSFKKQLRFILSSEKVHRVISSLLSQSKQS